MLAGLGLRQRLARLWKVGPRGCLVERSRVSAGGFREGLAGLGGGAGDLLEEKPRESREGVI